MDKLINSVIEKFIAAKRLVICPNSEQMTRPYVRPESGAKTSRQAPTHFTQQDLDTSMHRLSRPAPKYAAPNVIRPESSQGYALEFFRSNPDVSVDKRSPAEKLEEIQSLLQGDLQDQERFTLLAQRKSLAFLAFGENSREALQSLAAIARFYNAQNRPESALRHLAKAQEIADGLDPGPESERVAFAVETADAHLQSKRTNRQDAAKHVSAAESALEPFANVAIEDTELAYRRDLLLARVKVRRRQFAQAFEMYDRAVQSFSVLNEGVPTGETASLWIEIAEAAEKAKDDARAGKMYRRAHRTFLALNMPEAARMIEDKVPPGADEPGDSDLESEPLTHSETASGTEIRDGGLEDDPQ
jgi:tetratricopeptide (TPR) repeat protein